MITDKMFRAMCVYPDMWVHGYLTCDGEGYWIHSENDYLVDANSIGMNTGMKDVAGNYIYGSVEINGIMNRGGDIVSIPSGYGGDYYCKETTGIVEYEAPEFYIKTNTLKDNIWSDLTIIGNQFTTI